MNFFSQLFNKNKLSLKREYDLLAYYHIPEPTRSLIFINNDDISKIRDPNSIILALTITDDRVNSNIDNGKNFYAEPSAIWTKLPVEKNNLLETEPIYYPKYSKLSPKNRYQYLMWLCDVTRDTNLSYVFLYYYGLERHLLAGNFELAFKEIIRLLRYHDRGTFRRYAETALIVSSLYRKRFDLIQENIFLYDGVSNEELIIRKYMGIDLTAEDLMKLIPSVGLSNRRYFKLYPKKFKKELEGLLHEYNEKNGQILDCVSMESIEKEKSIAFANCSLNDEVRSIIVPDILHNKKLKEICLSLLERTNYNLKIGRETIIQL